MSTARLLKLLLTWYCVVLTLGCILYIVNNNRCLFLRFMKQTLANHYRKLIHQRSSLDNDKIEGGASTEDAPLDPQVLSYLRPILSPDCSAAKKPHDREGRQMEEEARIAELMSEAKVRERTHDCQEYFRYFALCIKNHLAPFKLCD